MYVRSVESRSDTSRGVPWLAHLSQEHPVSVKPLAFEWPQNVSNIKEFQCLTGPFRLFLVLLWALKPPTAFFHFLNAFEDLFWTPLLRPPVLPAQRRPTAAKRPCERAACGRLRPQGPAADVEGHHLGRLSGRP